MDVYIDGGQTFGSQSKFIVKIKQTPNGVRSHWMIHREALSYRTIAMKDKLATIIQAFNCVKASAVNAKLFTKLSKDMDSNHETLLFHTSVRWLSNFKLLAPKYKIKDELMLLFFSKLLGNKRAFC